MEKKEIKDFKLDDLYRIEKALREIEPLYKECSIGYALMKVQDAIDEVEPDWMSMSIAHVVFSKNGNLDTRIHGACLRLGIHTLGELALIDASVLMSHCSNVGEKVLTAIDDYFHDKWYYDWHHHCPRNKKVSI